MPFNDWTSGAWMIKLLNKKKKKNPQETISVADGLIESFLWHQCPPPWKLSQWCVMDQRWDWKGSIVTAWFLPRTHVFLILILPPWLPRWWSGKESACHCRRQEFDPWVGKIPWWRKWQSTPVFLPGGFHGQRSLVGYGPWGCKELDMTEHHACKCIMLPWSTLNQISIPSRFSDEPFGWGRLLSRHPW